jgi:hypothetical protein
MVSGVRWSDISSKRLRLIWVVLAVAAAACARPGSGTAPASSASLDKPRLDHYTRSDDGHDAMLVVNEAGRMLSLTLTPRHHERGLRPMDKRLETWRPLLEQLFRERGRRPEYFLTVGEYPELRRRIAEAAVCSGKWDPVTGRPRIGDAGLAMKDLLIGERLYPELNVFFASLGYLVSVEYAGGVMICGWNELGGSDARCDGHKQAGFVAPCGASIIFKLTRKEDATP